jgi:hypothetical protein
VTQSLRTVQALIVVDMQTAFVSGDEAVPEAAALLTTITDLMRRAREAGSLVVQLQNDGLPGTADEPYTPGWELFLTAAEGDGQHVIPKTTDDGFHETDLSDVLTERRIRHLAGHATYNIPAVEGLADTVPHAMASRVAEWALGDQIDIIAHADDVQFEPDVSPAMAAMARRNLSTPTKTRGWSQLRRAKKSPLP